MNCATEQGVNLTDYGLPSESEDFFKITKAK